MEEKEQKNPSICMRRILDSSCAGGGWCCCCWMAAKKVEHSK